MRDRGIEHGPAFTAITGLDVSADGGAIWAGVELPQTAAGPHGLRVHPVLLDACAQTLTVGLVLGPGSGLILPLAPPPRSCRSRPARTRSGNWPPS
jgi:hypothetical protein